MRTSCFPALGLLIMIPPQNLTQCTGSLRFKGVSQQVNTRAKTRTYVDDLPVESTSDTPRLQKNSGGTKEIAQIPRDLWFSPRLDRGIWGEGSLSPFLCHFYLISCTDIASGLGEKYPFPLFNDE